jgi:hypothetical protein
MSNQNEIINSSLSLTTKMSSLDQLLDSLGFNSLKTMTVQIILPSFSFLGIITCSFSFWIFLHKNFKDPVFFYYRLLCLIYIIQLLHNIPLLLFFSPRYFPSMNEYEYVCKRDLSHLFLSHVGISLSL